MAKVKLQKTEYPTFTGTAYWARVALNNPDEYLGVKKWKLDLVMDDPEEWKKFESMGIQKKRMTGENGDYWKVERPVEKMIAGKLVHFAAPTIRDKDGTNLVSFVEDGKQIYSSDTPKDFNSIKQGTDLLIGNGSKVEVTVCCYNTQMGVGNRLESIKLLELVEYKAPEPVEGESKEPVKVSW